jgi:competence protein ComGC
MMSVTYGCEALAEMTMSQIKDLALEHYNRIVSTDRISNSAGYNNIVGAVCSSRRESQKKEIDPRQSKKN